MNQSLHKSIFSEAGQPQMDFVGDFDARYKAEIDPWEQSGRTGVRADYYAFSRARILSRLSNRLAELATGLEVGCGYGYLTTILGERFAMTGMDVSEIALKRAQKLNPGFSYLRGDITAEGFVPPSKFHFVILAQCWWYCLHEIDRTLQNCLACLEPGGLFVLSQAFLKNQQYGLKIANGFDGALRLLMSFPELRLVEAHYDDTGLLCYLDGLIIMRYIGVDGSHVS